MPRHSAKLIFHSAWTFRGDSHLQLALATDGAARLENVSRVASSNVEKKVKDRLNSSRSGNAFPFSNPNSEELKGRRRGGGAREATETREHACL